MNQPQDANPFDELRSLLSEFRADKKVSAGNETKVDVVLTRVDEWIALAEQRRNRSESIIASARDAFVSIDSAGLIIEWNRQAEEVFGWSKEEAIGKSLADTIIPEDQRSAHRNGDAPRERVEFAADCQLEHRFRPCRVSRRKPDRVLRCCLIRPRRRLADARLEFRRRNAGARRNR